jgi:iron complex outermembrane receptor protein
VVGGGYRVEHNQVGNAPALQFQPPTTTEYLGNAFAEDTISLSKTLKLTAGLKLENDPFSGLAALPDARLSWQLDASAMVWAAVSRAVRAPSLFDRDVREYLGKTLFLEGGADFESEKLWAYQAGTRVEPIANMSLSLSAYYNVYTGLRSIEPTIPTLLPLYFGNLMAGHVYGLEGWGSYSLTTWWRLSAGFNVQREDLRFLPASSGLAALDQAALQETGNDPDHQIMARSDINFTKDIAWDADLRYVSALPNPAVPSYLELNSSLTWNATSRLEFALTGDNLLQRRHIEFAASASAFEIARSVFLDARWRF